MSDLRDRRGGDRSRRHQRGEFLPAYVNTIRSVFGERNVALAGEWPATVADAQATFVVIASTELAPFMHRDQRQGVTIVEPRTLTAYVARRHPPLLTDDYAPVDNLVASLFEQRYRYRAQ